MQEFKNNNFMQHLPALEKRRLMLASPMDSFHLSESGFSRFTVNELIMEIFISQTGAGCNQVRAFGEEDKGINSHVAKSAVPLALEISLSSNRNS